MTSPMIPFLLRAGAEGDAIRSKDHWIDISSNFYQILNDNSSLIKCLCVSVGIHAHMTQRKRVCIVSHNPFLEI